VRLITAAGRCRHGKRKGNEARQLPLFNVEPQDHRRQLAEKYELLRRLWREEGLPGTAVSAIHCALAAKWGDPLFNANRIHLETITECIIDHYRVEYEAHGHDPRYAYVGAGSGFLYLADTTREAKEHYGPAYERIVAFFNAPGYDLQPFSLPTVYRTNSNSRCSSAWRAM
jgi:alkanesulfonate monooxygenase SsuD/methylene tetrahydromethanopterin reductase-like flavin-dependent oxidoreductase (luciferase family)